MSAAKENKAGKPKPVMTPKTNIFVNSNTFNLTCDRELQPSCTAKCGPPQLDKEAELTGSLIRPNLHAMHSLGGRHRECINLAVADFTSDFITCQFRFEKVPETVVFILCNII